MNILCKLKLHKWIRKWDKSKYAIFYHFYECERCGIKRTK
jgi:hypothetical protein